MIDRTNQYALQKAKEKYGDQIIDYVYKSWKEAYLDRPPKNAFCSGFTRYRTCYKVTHVKLKDGTTVPIETNGCLVAFIVGIAIFLFFYVISLFVQ